MEKLKVGIFNVDHQIRQFKKVTDFIHVITVLKIVARKSFVWTLKNFLSNHKNTNYEDIVKNSGSRSKH